MVQHDRGPGTLTEASPLLDHNSDPNISPTLKDTDGVTDEESRGEILDERKGQNVIRIISVLLIGTYCTCTMSSSVGVSIGSETNELNRDIGGPRRWLHHAGYVSDHRVRVQRAGELGLAGHQLCPGRSGHPDFGMPLFFVTGNESLVV